MKTQKRNDWENFSHSGPKTSSGPRSLAHFRGFKYLLTAWFLASGFPKPAGWEYVLDNTNIAMTLTFLLSGFMSRYSNSDLGRDSLSQHMRRKFGVLVPLHALAFIWTLGLCAKEGWPSFVSLISNLLLISSLISFHPLMWWFPGTPEVQTCPSLTIGSSLCVCWVVYPFFQRLKDRFFPVKSLRYVIFCGLVILLPSVPGGIVLLEARSRQSQQVFATEVKGAIGNATWFIHPFFKLPIFLVGSMVADVALNAGWGAAREEDDRNRKVSIIKKLLGGVVVDSVLVVLIITLLFSPDDRATQSVFSWIGSSYYGLLGSSRYIRDVESWYFTGWFLSLPAAALLILLFSLPIAEHSIICKTLSLQPLADCLPSRSSLVLPVVYPLMLYTLPESTRIRIQSGNGHHSLLLSALFLSVVFTRYVMDPWHVWVLHFGRFEDNFVE